MQKGFITLENLYNKKKAELESLQEAQREQSADYDSTFTKILDELDEKKKTIENLSATVDEKVRQVEILSAELDARKKRVKGTETVATSEAEGSVSRPLQLRSLRSYGLLLCSWGRCALSS